MCRLCEENKNPEALWIDQGKHWNVHVCWFQHTLGTLGIILNHHVESFAELTPDELTELTQLLQKFQVRLEKELNPDWLNIQMNCNWHHHIHFLLLPRYKKPREFYDKTYDDRTFGEPITYTKIEESNKTRRSLTDLLR